MWERKQLLVWGTTYPEFSKTYYETVCMGAIDGATGRLMRIYPITLRHMKEPFHASVDTQNRPVMDTSKPAS
jgi:hypothetical protein